MQVLTYEIMFEFSFDSGHLLPLIFLHNFSPWWRSTSLGTAEPACTWRTCLTLWMPLLQPLHPPIAVEITWGRSPCCETKKRGVWCSLAVQVCNRRSHSSQCVSVKPWHVVLLVRPCQGWTNSGTVRPKVLLSAGRRAANAWLADVVCLLPSTY